MVRHRTYHSLGFDLGLFDQVFWNTTQGRPFESTMSQALAVPHSFLGDHFSPGLAILLPFYALYPHPETLVVAQTLALAVGAWPVYLLARLKLPAEFAPVWVVAFFLFIPLAYINLFDFHEVALSVAPLGFALYFLERGRKVWFLVFLVFAILLKEEMALIAVGFGAYALLGKRDWRVGAGLVVGGVAVFLLLIDWVIPYLGGGRGYPYISGRYADVGGSPMGVVRTLVTDPLRIARALLQAKKLEFLVAIFGPVLGLSAIAGWATLVMVPTLAYLLLSSYEQQFAFTSQYSAPLIALVIGTAIIALARLPRRTQGYVAGAVLVSSLAFAWAYGDLPFSRKFDPSQFEMQARYAPFVAQLAQIPAGARVSAEDGLASQMSERRYLYDYHFQGLQDAQWVVLDYAGAGYSMAVFDAQVADAESKGYAEVASGYGLALLRRS